ASGRGGARAAVRARPVDPDAGDARRDDRQQRLRVAGARVRADERQRPRPGRRDRHRGAAEAGGRPRRRRRVRAAGAAAEPGGRRSRADPDRVRAVRAAGLRLLPRTPAAREGLRRRAGAGGQRGDARADPGGAGADGPRARAASAGRPGVRIDGRARRRRPGDPAARARGDAAVPVRGSLPTGPVSCERRESRITGVGRERRGPGAAPPLPRGSGWLLVVLAGPELGALREAARAVARDSGCADSAAVEDTALADALWRIREDGSGLVARTPEGEQAHAGWEDAAVPPERLGAYLREFEALLAEHGLYGVPYGHFGDGCIHVRIDFPFGRPDGRRVFRGFLGEAAALAARHDGTMSGEHGDGRARGELLPHMYSAE